MKSIEADVVVVGGGPAGAAASIKLLERGVRPVIIERERFPRFHIGESMTGECGNLLRELGFGDQMTAAGHAVKHGVAVYGAKGRADWFVPVKRRNADLSSDPATTWQVRRSLFDSMMLDRALEDGAELVAGRATEPIMGDDGAMGGVVVDMDGETVRVTAPMTLDCSGQATFLANRKITGQKYVGSYDKQIAIFSHVSGFECDPATDRAELQPGNAHIFYTRKYHWAWALPIDDEITSIGIVVPAAYFRESGLSKHDFFVREMHELNVGLAQRTMDAQLTEDVHVIPNYSFQVRHFAGPGFVCVGDSHRFVDPIFSFGLYLALQESARAVETSVKYLDGSAPDRDRILFDHMVEVEKAADIYEDMIDTFWENPLAFGFMAHSRYREPMIDVFAGRVYEGMPHAGRDEAVAAFRRLLGRERTYDADGLFSVPIGSRFHEERAPLWNSTLNSVESTERWILDQV